MSNNIILEKCKQYELTGFKQELLKYDLIYFIKSTHKTLDSYSLKYLTKQFLKHTTKYDMPYDKQNLLLNDFYTESIDNLYDEK